jgi:hypothetical protein
LQFEPERNKSKGSIYDGLKDVIGWSSAACDISYERNKCKETHFCHSREKAREFAMHKDVFFLFFLWKNEVDSATLKIPALGVSFLKVI